MKTNESIYLRYKNDPAGFKRLFELYLESLVAEIELSNVTPSVSSER